MSRLLAIAAAGALALSIGASAASANSATVPGPKQPVEHLGISGAHFSVRSGNPHCFSGSGSVGAGFAVPRGAMVTGATAYAVDSEPTTSIHVELARHNFTDGGTHILGEGRTTVNGASTIDIDVNRGYVLGAGEAVNLIVDIPSGTCFKGAEVHFIRNPAPTTTAPVAGPTAPNAAQPTAPTADLAPDGR